MQSDDQGNSVGA